MKKIPVLLLAALMLFLLAACGTATENSSVKEEEKSTTTQNDNKEEEKSTTTQNGNNDETTEADTDIIQDLDFNAIMAGNGATDVIWGKQDEATKQALIAEGKEDGVDISFGTDGSMTVVDSESGDTIIQKPDGNWIIKGDDGSEGQYGGEWPDNEFTRLLPKPDFELMAANTSDTGFTVGFKNATLEQVKEYAEQVKAKGFTIDAETVSEEVMNMTIYTYKAKNSDGYTVTVSCAMGTSAVLLEKP